MVEKVRALWETAATVQAPHQPRVDGANPRRAVVTPQPYKGARMRAYTRVHPDVLAQAQRLADERRIGLSDWIAEAMEQKAKRDSTRRRGKAVA